MSINILGTYISTTVVASIAAGVGVVLILLILLSCWCFRRKGGERRERETHSASVENPRAPPKGNQNVEPTQQRQQQNNPPKMAEQRKDLYRPLPPAASPVQQAQRPPSRSPVNLPSQYSVGSTNNSPLPTQPSRRSPTEFPLDYQSSGKSNLSGSESSIPPPSPAFSHVSSQTMFTYNELAMVTNGFCEANLLGEGGFGFVHKGVLPNGKQVAVKSLRPNSRQGEREFAAEVETISRVHHRHLVALVGYCISGQKRLLVYEFVANKTLEFHLHGKEQPTMDWATRMKVALGAAKGLAYLHEDCQPKIIHRDIKAANILIDNNYQAKVADFGLAKLSSEEYTHITTRVMGTLGYLAPEYASSGRLTDKSDVYSFGVVLLELITGRRPVDRTEKEYNIVQWARPLLTTAIEDENVNHLVDPRLQFSYKLSEMARMVSCAAACVRKSARHRPMMSQIVRALEGNLSISDLNEGLIPGYSMIHRYDSTSEHSGSQYKGDSIGLDSNNMAPSTTEYVSSEFDGTTCEYGLYASSTSTEAQTTRELDTEEVLRERRRFHQQQFRPPSS